jgi:ACT domain-containing protein
VNDDGEINIADVNSDVDAILSGADYDELYDVNGDGEINIADITQTILSGNFVMMMMVDMAKADIDIDTLRKSLSTIAEEMGVEINIMAEKVFSAMHRV